MPKYCVTVSVYVYADDADEAAARVTSDLTYLAEGESENNCGIHEFVEPRATDAVIV